MSSNRESRVLPDGCIDIIFNLGDPLRHRDHDSFAENSYRQYVVGAMRKPMLVGMKGQIHLIAIRFKPGGAFPFLRLPAHELSDRSVQLDDVWKDMDATLAEQLIELPTLPQRIAFIDNVMQERLATMNSPDRLLNNAIATIEQGKGQISIEQLGNSLDISPRHLERKFREQVGFSPKIFSRIMRVQYAIELLQKQTKPDWGDIVFMAGFYDQAHFIREFKGFSGLTPGAYVHEHT